MVSWSPSPVAEAYHVIAVSENGHAHTCNTTSSNCSVSELHCEQQYAVSVTASHENCSSKASQNVTITTGISLTQTGRMPVHVRMTVNTTVWRWFQQFDFLSTQAPASLMVSQLHTTVTTSLHCCRGRPETTPWNIMAVPRMEMQTCCTVKAQLLTVLSRVLIVEQLIISLSKHQTGNVTAPSVN